MIRPDIAVFLDRDGTVNVEENFISSAGQLRLIPRSASAIRALNDLGAKVFIITNQSGVARGYFTEAAVRDVNDALKTLLKKEGAVVDDFFYCPHLPGAPDKRYDVVCDCRKPKPGMLHQAREKYGVDLRNSFVVGDRCVDIQAGKAAGTGTVMVSTGYGSEDIRNCRNLPDFVASDLFDGVLFIKDTIAARSRSFTQSSPA